MTVRVVLADDQTVVRAGFRALLDLTDDLVVVAEAADGTQAVEAVRLTRPDVVLMDIRMPGVDGIEATRRIAADRPWTAYASSCSPRTRSTRTSSRRCGTAPRAFC
jgi:DNA-binding NarL/FixJ family response regulator